MKKLMMLLYSVCAFLMLSGCQPSNTTTEPGEFVEQFITDFLSFEYDQDASQIESFTQVSEKIHPYFTEECYSTFIKYNYGGLPIQVANKYQSDLTVKEVQLDELFNETSDVGYTVEVSLQLPSEVAKLILKLSIIEENKTWNIYAIQISHVDDSLQ